MIPTPQEGVFHHLEGLAEARLVSAIEEVTITVHAGQRLEPLPEGALYMGFIFARGESAEQVETALRTAMERLVFVFESPS